ncbi:sensor histidine kinase [Nocardia sp. BMG51109]|uniref:sensor histidine kinase n=1 Tax=Nocardia sp. BMG51109 TaxID=1056816 RepID=UPI00046347A1|nr:sensor histidine kinase [Nocardia sp. BMG51109]
MRDLLRSVWNEPQAPDPPRRSWRDWALVGAFVGLAIIEGIVRQDLPHRIVWVPVAVAILPALLWRRSRPLPMVTVAFTGSAAATVLLGGEQSGIGAMGAMLLLPYALYRWGSGRDIVMGSAVAFTTAGIAMLAGDVRVGDAIAGFLVLSAAVALGLAFRYRARAKVRERERIKLIERERLARDLHDTVAHHVSAMAIRAQAGLATAETTPGAAVDALRLIEAEAASTLAEMRTIVRVLRRNRPVDDGDHTPGIADLASLAAQAGAGPSVEVEVDGEIADLPPALGTAIYRLAQESVTNAVRHARNATRIEVHVTTDDASVRLLVRDDGDGGPARSAGAGYGLAGMVERAGLLGGTCRAGPNPERGWTVTAVLPRERAAT